MHVPLGPAGEGLYSLATVGCFDVMSKCQPLVLAALPAALAAAVAQRRPLSVCDFGAADGGTSLPMWHSFVSAARRSHPDVEISMAFEDQARRRLQSRRSDHFVAPMSLILHPHILNASFCSPTTTGSRFSHTWAADYAFRTPLRAPPAGAASSVRSALCQREIESTTIVKLQPALHFKPTAAPGCKKHRQRPVLPSTLLARARPHHRMNLSDLVSCSLLRVPFVRGLPRGVRRRHRHVFPRAVPAERDAAPGLLLYGHALALGGTHDAPVGCASPHAAPGLRSRRRCLRSAGAPARSNGALRPKQLSDLRASRSRRNISESGARQKRAHVSTMQRCSSFGYGIIRQTHRGDISCAR